MKFVPKFQEGGAMPAPEEMPAEQAPVQEAPQGGEEDQIMQAGAELAQMLLQQVGDPQAALAILDAAAQAIQQMAQPQAGFARMGGKLVRIR